MGILSGDMLYEIDDPLLDKSYKMSKGILESNYRGHLKPFVIYKTFKNEIGLVVLPIKEDSDEEFENIDRQNSVSQSIKELCRQKRVSDIYISTEMEYTFDKDGYPISDPEYYLFITHETHLSSNIYVSEIFTNEDDKTVISPLFKMNEGIDKVGPFFNILCPLKFHNV